MVMNKSEFVNLFAEKNELSKKDAEKAVNSFCNIVTDVLKSGESINLKGFGSFSVSTRAARQGRNLSTGELMDIPETKVPKFKAGSSLKEAVK